MKIPPYWSKAQHPVENSNGRTDSVSACGWSFSSLEDAKAQASLRAKRIFDIVSRGQKPDTYDYCDRPVKEEIIREILDEKEQIALITRNRYGALVLNSAKVLFADIAIDGEHFVVVPLFTHCAPLETITDAARRSRSLSL